MRSVILHLHISNKMAGVEELYKNFGILADAGEKIAEVFVRKINQLILFFSGLFIC